MDHFETTQNSLTFAQLIFKYSLLWNQCYYKVLFIQ